MRKKDGKKMEKKWREKEKKKIKYVLFYNNPHIGSSVGLPWIFSSCFRRL